MEGEPIINRVDDLIGRKDKWGRDSMPRNPVCKLSSSSCSEAMKKDDLCFFHFHLLGKIKEYSCGCPGKKWEIAIGNHHQRDAAQRYYPEKNLGSLQYGCNLFCCKRETTSYEKCGPMFVCDYCAKNHPMVGQESSDGLVDEFGDKATTWKHYPTYGIAVRNCWTSHKKFWKYAEITNTGLWFETTRGSLQSSSVSSAATALIAAGNNIADAEWWIWIAGWYEDCPKGIAKHF